MDGESKQQLTRPTYWRAKLVGSTTRSVARPCSFWTNVAPPSTDLKIPMLGRSRKKSSVLTSRAPAFAGSTKILDVSAFEKGAVAASVHVDPPSADRSIPPELRSAAFAYAIDALLGANATAPECSETWPSVVGAQVVPASCVSQMPPLSAAASQ